MDDDNDDDEEMEELSIQVRIGTAVENTKDNRARRSKVSHTRRSPRL